MSLEQELARNTEAMIALTAALTARAAPAAPVEQPVEKVKPPKLVAVGTTSSAPAATPDTPVADAAPSAVDYATVAKAITDTFKVDRVKTIEALAKFGAAKGPQLKPADYAAFLAELAA